MLTADQMRALPDFFADIPDPRRRQGRRHPLPAVLAVATAAVLCGMPRGPLALRTDEGEQICPAAVLDSSWYL